MELTVDLEPEAYRRPESLVAERGETTGTVLGDAIVGEPSNENEPPKPTANIYQDEQGFP